MDIYELLPRSKSPDGKSYIFYGAITSLFLISLIASLNSVALASALPAITIGLDAASDSAFWTGTAFLLCQTVTTPIFGVFSEFLGRKMILLGCLLAFMIATALCSTAQNISWLIGARVLQGIAAGGLNPMVSVVLVDLVPLRDRGKVTGIFTLSQFLGLPAGITLGAVLSEYASWRWVFYLTIPFSAASFFGIFFMLNAGSPQISAREGIRKLDWIGMGIFVGSTLSLLIGIVSGGNVNAWNSAKTIIPIVFGSLGLVVFIAFEHFGNQNPLIPLRLFANRTAASGFVSSWIHGFVFWASSYYLILYFLGARDHSLLQSSIDVLPGVLTLVFSAGAAGFIYARFRRFQKLMWAAWSLTTLGLALMTLLSPTSNAAEQYLFPVITSLGGGIILPGRLLSVQASQKDEDAPLATTMVAFMLSLGQAFGVGIGGSILENRWEQLLSRRNIEIPTQFLLSSREVDSAWRRIPSLPEPFQQFYRELMADSIRSLYAALAVLAGIALSSSFFSENLTLDRDARGKQGFEMEMEDEES